MSKKTESTPAVFIEQTRAYEIFQLMLQGKTITEIGKALGTPEENIRSVIAKERLKLTAGMQEMQEQFMGITYARTEWLISKIFPIIEKQSLGENPQVDKNLVKTALDIMKFQKDVIVPGEVDKSDKGVVINQTFVASSPLYEQAMQEMQNDFLANIRVEPEMPNVIKASPEMIRLEELATQYLTEGERNARDPLEE